MIRVMVKTPVKTRNYFSFYVHKRKGGGVMKTSSPVTLLRRIEYRLKKALSTYSGRPKINVLTVYGHGYSNEGDYDTFERAFYALICFLEDYLQRKSLESRLNKYIKYQI